MIPLSVPEITDEDCLLIDQVLRSRHLARGPFTEQFENAFASRFGARFAVAVSSGTAALHLAIIAAGVRDCDLVITSPYSFIASSNVILYERAIPVFVDIDPDTLALDPRKTIEAIRCIARRCRTWRTLLPRGARNSEGSLRAVLPAHLFGCPTDIRDIVAAAHEEGVSVIEDACETIGAMTNGIYAGRFGDAAGFGFYPNKQMTTGEGGMLLTDREDWAELFRSLRNQGRGTDAEQLHCDRLGFNYRIDEMSAALGVSQFRRLDQWLLERAAIAERYAARLANVDGVTAPRAPASTKPSWFVYPVRLAPEIDRAAVMRGMAARGITTRPYFWPIHLQPFYATRFGFTEGDYPAAEAAGRSMLSLPLSPSLSDADVETVCAALAEELRRA